MARWNNKNCGFQKGHKIGIGRKLSEENKRKLSLANKGKQGGMFGKKHTKETKKRMGKAKIGKPSGMLNKKHTEETKRKIKLSMIGRKSPKYWLGKKRPEISGKNHYNWKNGITPINTKIRMNIEGCLWREAVFARDNWTCQKTKIKGGKLHSHHINNFADFPELRTSIENGITLSEKTHRKFHQLYGWRNNTKEQLEEFLLVKVGEI